MKTATLGCPVERCSTIKNNSLSSKPFKHTVLRKKLSTSRPTGFPEVFHIGKIHVGTAVLACPVERSSTASFSSAQQYGLPQAHDIQHNLTED